MHPLHRALVDAAGGRFPAVDGRVEVHPVVPGGDHAVVEFTGHAFVLTDLPPEEVTVRARDGFGGAGHPDVIRWLAGPSGPIGSHDAVLVAVGLGGGDLPVRDDLEDHPRVRRAREHRADVRVHGDASGLVTLGHGLVDRLEISVELTAGSGSGRGAGRALIMAGRALVPAGDLVWAQVAPGNASSLRAFLSCGFAPICAETLFRPGGSRPPARSS